MTLSSDASLQPSVFKLGRRQVIFITLAACLIYWVFVFADSGWLFGFLLNTAGPHWAVLFCIAFVTVGELMELRLWPVQQAVR